MKTQKTNARIDLRLSLIDAAQCFHWVETERGFGAVLEGNGIWLKPGMEIVDARLRRYLDLDRDYQAIAREYEDIPAAQKAFTACPGLRVLNQPPWEALFSFILSANNNVVRIRSLVYAISRAYGAEADGLYGIPGPEAVAAASEDALRALGAGYRAPYLIETARAVCEGFPLESLRDLPYEEAHARLTSLKGVGDKVADCVLLFGCGHAEAFPVDVWVARLLHNWFGQHGSRRQLGQWARQRFGAHGGILQQYLFHAARTGAVTL
ncbi:MAG TPA: DNA-3-methyladenine glycosylase 2 family protein [Candidatus Pullichristensenella stercorigallinarum]|uniref:DNA-(apurinic or apyrimidinic site) lyase n=1 Tax=Candidatus Pullichristensenella stercorigallinarum TaxID=2840909 RepID=A0A9D1CX36_9FIRM|nr:DNA-3-methyladenine glycosylase 2 family protein [Candidatus Pullichristensenella stercorigallinarum]